MKRFLIAGAAAALFGTTTASACVIDTEGKPVVDSEGKPVESGIGLCEVTLDSAVLFSTGSAVLSAAGKRVLDSLDADAISTITGYASIEGSEVSNQALSEARAQAVADYLGVDATVIGAGETSRFGSDLRSNRVVVVS